MVFRILGPLDVTSAGTPVQLGGPRQRGLLTYLLLHANETVPAERLVDRLWVDPPRGGLAALQTQVYRLRRELGDRVVRVGGGYAVRVEPGELDLEVFRSLLAEAAAAGDPAERSRLLREADELWRGEPLAGLDDLSFVRIEAAALEELRLGAIEDRVAADLDRGLDGELVAELSSLVAAYPLRERLRGQLILALYRSGRQADALEAYRETRRMLDAELGLEPSPPLRELEGAILRQDPGLVAVPAATAAAGSPERRASRHWRRLVLGGVAFLVVGAAGAATVVLAVGSGSVRVESETVVEPAAPAAPKPTAYVLQHAAHQARHTKARRTVHPVFTQRAVVRMVTTAEVATTAAKTTPLTSIPTTTATATITQHQTTTTAPAVQISDDFSSPTIDTLTWGSWTSGTGAASSQQDGRLLFTIPADAGFESQWHSAGINYGTKCKFQGDFDARVDYALLTWPSDEGASVSLTAFQSGPVDEITRQVSSAYGNVYTSWPGSGSAPLDDTSGSLRIARSNGVVRTYILHDGKWRSLDARRIDGELWVGMTLMSFSTDWQQSEVDVAFDNFSLTAPDADCPAGSDPRQP